MTGPASCAGCGGGRRAGGEAWLLLVTRLLLGGLFIFAGVIKLQDPQTFLFSVKAFDLFPEHAGHLVVLTTFLVPWAEVVAGAMLVLGVWARASALVHALLLAAFIAGIGSVLARGLAVECGCFGKYSPFCRAATVGWCNIVQNAVLLGMALVVLWRGPGALSPRGGCGRA